MSSFQRTIPSFTSNTCLSVSADKSQHSSSRVASVSRNELLLSAISSKHRSLVAYSRNRTVPSFVKQPTMNPIERSLNHFHWPESNYDAPIHVHRRTSESHLRWAMNRITDVHVYTIDTESDNPTHQHRPSIPSLIQVQAIHEENYSTVFLIEVKHLPHHSSSPFLLIQQLCRIMFSPSNQLIIWESVMEQSLPFEQFNLFNPSRLTNILNL